MLQTLNPKKFLPCFARPARHYVPGSGSFARYAHDLTQYKGTRYARTPNQTAPRHSLGHTDSLRSHSSRASSCAVGTPNTRHAKRGSQVPWLRSLSDLHHSHANQRLCRQYYSHAARLAVPRPILTEPHHGLNSSPLKTQPCTPLKP